MKDVDADDVERFRNRGYYNTCPFAYQEAAPYVRVVDVYDGDTIKVVMEVYPGRFHRVDLRLCGIDTCEMTSKDPDEKRRAVLARDRLLDWVTGGRAQRMFLDTGPGDGSSVPSPPLSVSITVPPPSRDQVRELLNADVFLVHIEVKGTDKYGRILAVVRQKHSDHVTFNERLLAEGLAKPYDGGRKT